MAHNIKNVGELIEFLQKFDPETRVGLEGDSGGTVKPISRLNIDDLWVAKTDRTFATIGRYVNMAGFGKKFMKNEGRIIIFE